MVAIGPSRHFAATQQLSRFQGHSRHGGPAAGLVPVENDPQRTSGLHPVDGTRLSIITMTRIGARRAAFTAPDGLFLLREEPEFL